MPPTILQNGMARSLSTASRGHAATKPIRPASRPCAPTSSCATRSSNRCLPVSCVPLADRQRTKPRSINTTSGYARNSTEPSKPSALRRLEKFATQRQHVGVRCSVSAYIGPVNHHPRHCPEEREQAVQGPKLGQLGPAKLKRNPRGRLKHFDHK